MSCFLQSVGQIDARRGHVTTIGQNQYNIHIQHADFTTKAEEDLVLARLKPIESPYIHRCMPGTRQWMINKIHDWMGNHHGPNILWLSGSPGAGKSAVASTLVSTLQEAGQLGSSFFCKRDDIALSDPAACWRTIAFDLAQYDPIIAHRIVENIKGKRVDPRRADIESHYQYLINDPLREFWRRHLANLRTNMEVDDEVNKRGTPLIAVVVDALDECGSNSSQYAQQQTFINTIMKWSDLPKPFKLIVTSRDDRIPNSFCAVCHRLVLDTGDIVGPEAINDVRVFFAKHFAAIATQNHSLSPTWPSESIIEQLMSCAAGLFVWAETVVKFVEQGIPNRRLNSILRDQFRYGSGRLDGLYRQVMNLSFQHATDDELEIYKLVIGAVVFAKIPLRQQDLRYFLGRDEEEASITCVLMNLSSVISTNAVDGCIHISHLSFTEFICDPNRCGERFVIRRDFHDRIMALACLQRMQTELQFNICQLETSHVRNVDVPNLASCIERFIPTRLSYSCRFWSDHLDTATIDAQVVHTVKYFLHTQFLFWLEVLSLIKEASIASQILMSIRKLLGPLNEDIYAFATDAIKFVSTFGSIICQNAPHIYISALPFTPTGSKIAQQFLPFFKGTLSPHTDKPAVWPRILNILEGHSDGVTFAAFSHDGKRIVSASYDKTIRVWDGETGEMILGPLKGHTDSVKSVAFSPDGNSIVSGARDKTIGIWDAETGKVVRRFKAHLDTVTSVAFMHDGKRIISGSSDNTIRVWRAEMGYLVAWWPASPICNSDIIHIAISQDVTHIASISADFMIRIWDTQTGETRTVFGPFKVCSIAFSPNGKRIVSGSYDDTIHVWDSEMGEMVFGPFTGHTSPVISVAFSPDGNRIVSGSQDNTVRVWDIETGCMVSKPLEGHNGWIRSVAFSSDGKRIVSSSDDETLRVWDAEAGEVDFTPFEGHSDQVVALSFSPDGKRIASGSWDSKICLWDVETGKLLLRPLEKYTSSVNSVAFSPDGYRIISGSSDGTICVWDAETGEVVSGPFEEHIEGVTSVAFASNCKHFISGSFDKTICVWDVETGQVTLGPLEGHDGAVFSIAFSRDSKRIVSGSDDSTIRVWDTEVGKLVSGPLKGQTDGVRSVAFSPDDKCIASGSWDKTICVWNAENGEMVLGPLKKHTGSVLAVAFTPDGKHIASGSLDKTICVWDAETGGLVLGPLEGHTCGVKSIRFSHDGNRIVSGSMDMMIRVLDVEAKEIVTHPFHDDLGETPKILDTASVGCCFGDRLKMVDGWMLGYNSELLFWVPPSVRNGLWWPRNVAIMGKAMKTKLDLKSFCHGKAWTQCKR